jgi:8-oxo-dGTP pyrophosphatase MutT (NUDIX family)
MEDRLNETNGEVENTCTECGKPAFENAKTVAIAMPRDEADTGFWLVQRGSIVANAGAIAFPGGYTGNECNIEAALRELFEETGLTAVADPSPYWSAKVPGRDENLLFFRCTVTGGKPTPSKETPKVFFVKDGELGAPLNYGLHHAAYERYVESRTLSGRFKAFVAAFADLLFKRR